MTDKEKREIFEELLRWVESNREEAVLYLQDRLYVVRISADVVALVKADDPRAAIIKAKAAGGVHIEHVTNLKL